MADNDLRIRFGVGHLSYKRKQRTRITYKSPSQITSPWISENCSSVEWYQNRGEGVLVLRSGINSIGGGESAEYSPFYGQASVTEVVLPEQITTIGDYAFDGCTNLDKVVITSEVPPTLGDNVFEDTTTVYVPYEYLDAYEEAWGDEVEIAPIGDYYQITVTAGEHGSATGSGWYVLNESVVLTATADEGYEFTQWNDGNTDNPRTITVLGDATYTAAFQEQVFGTVSYTSTNEATGGWVTYNTDTTKNTYDSTTHEGVLYLKSGAAPLGGGQSTDYSPFYTDTGLTAVDLSDTPFTAVGSDAFNGCTSLSSVVLPTGVTVLGNQAFRQCTALTSITIPNSVTTLGNTVFNSCSGATSLSVGNGLSQIGTNCFTDCSGLASITVASGNTTFNDGNGSNCIIQTSNNTLVFGCKNTVIPNTVTSIGNGAFRGCSGLTSINIPNSVTSFGTNVFQDCTGLTSVNIPDTVTSWGSQLFYNCTALASANIPTGVTTVPNECFRQCSALTSITIPSGITSIGNWSFRACTHLTSVTCEATTPPTLGTNNFGINNDTLYVPAASVSAYQADSEWSAAFTTITAIPVIRYTSTSELDTSWITTNTDTTRNTYDSNTGEGVLYLNEGVTEIGSSAFASISTLTAVDLDDAGLTRIGYYAFGNCSNLNLISIPNGVTSIDEWAFRFCRSLASINIPNTVTGIGKEAFQNCSGLTSATIGSGVRTIGNGAFQSCSGLTSVTIPNGVTVINEMVFQNCSSLASVTLGSGVTSIGRSAFYSCTSLTSITIPNGVTSIGNNVFSYCSGLTSINIPSGVTSIGSAAFDYCSSLTSITVDSNNTYYNDGNGSNCIIKTSTNELVRGCKNTVIPNTVTSIGYGAFNGCAGLSSISIPNSVTTIDANAFFGSTLTSINIPNSVTTIGGGAFQSCSSLASATIPSGITIINDGVFNGCSSLSSITIPSGVTSIRFGAFGGCTALTSVTCEATTPPTLAGSNFQASGDTLYVPAASVSAYQADSNWSSSFTTITAIVVPAQIRYTSTNQASGGWVTNNTDTTKNTYDSVTGNGVLYLNAGVTGIGGNNWSTDDTPFYGDSGLTAVDLDDAGLIYIGQDAFVDCSALTSINIPSSITNVDGYSFAGCSALVSMTVDSNNTYLNDGNGSNCIIKTSNNQLLSGCNTTVIPNTVLYIQTAAFSGRTGLTSITIPSGVTSIPQNTFDNCSGLTSATIGSGVTTIGRYAFNCTNLTSVTCEATTPPTFDPQYYNFTASNDTLYVPAASVSAYQSDSAWSSAFTTITAIPTPTPPQIRYTSTNQATGTWVTNNTDTTQNTYDSTTHEGVLYLNEGVTSIGGAYGTANQSPFYGDTGLTAVDLSDAGLTTIGESAFDSCEGLTSISIPSGVTSIGTYAFGSCEGLTSLDIPDSVTTIGENAFRGSYYIASATIGSGVTTIGQAAFRDCDALTSVTCKATTPPTLGTRNFEEYGDTLYVPAASLSAYQSDSSWSAAFTTITAIS